MKTLLTTLLFATSLALPAAERPVGSVSRNSGFAVNEGNGFTASRLSEHEGKILVLMFMTPWCPICQSHSSAVGDGILDHYNAPSRKKLRGKNAHGIPIESILLSTEPAAQWDTVNAQFSARNGFMRWGLDAKPDRSSPRTLLGYFRGGFIRSSDLYDWGDDRRRLVVINLVRNSRTHAYREIILNQNAFTSADYPSARRAIDAVKMPSKQTLPFP
jgi:thiol-disulfide isomerase/thioredoxin